MKRPIGATQEVLDLVGRAQKWRRMGNVRIPFWKLGFWPKTRGDTGICEFHVHEVTHYCMVNTARIKRYNNVGVVKIPSDLFQEIRDHTKRRCQNSLLMPLYSDQIE